MSTTIINIQINGKVAVSPPEKIVCDNSDYEIEFKFDSSWDDYPVKTAQFIYNGIVIDEPINGTRAKVPPVIDAITLEVGIYAGDISTTTPAVIECLPSIRGKHGSPPPPRDEVYNKIISLIKIMNGRLIIEVDALPENEFASDNAIYRLRKEVDGELKYTLHVLIGNNWKEIKLDFSEYALVKDLDAEKERSINADKVNADAITAETERAKKAESALAGSIQDTNKVLHSTQKDLVDEVDRAKVKEQILQEALNQYKAQVDAILESDDIDLDRVQEMVDYMKNNKDLIDAITINKVNVSDIVDNLLSSAINKPLSANQGRVLNTLIDAITKSLEEHKTAYETKVTKLDEADEENADAIKEEVTRAKAAEENLADGVKTANDYSLSAFENATATLNIAKEAKNLASEANVISKQTQADLETETNRAQVKEQSLEDALNDYRAQVNAILESDDVDLDRVQEMVDYMKNNKDLIDAITINKVNISDIVDNLLSSAINKPLSANQGRVLKELIVTLTNSLNTEIARAKTAEANCVQQKEYSTAQYAPNFDDGDCARAYVRNSDNTEDSILVSKYTKPHAIPLRDANGNLFTLTPVDKNHSANKQYVDDTEEDIRKDISGIKEKLLTTYTAPTKVIETLKDGEYIGFATESLPNYDQLKDATITVRYIYTVDDVESGEPPETKTYKLGEFLTAVLSNEDGADYGAIYKVPAYGNYKEVPVYVVREQHNFEAQYRIDFDGNGIYLGKSEAWVDQQKQGSTGEWETCHCIAEIIDLSIPFDGEAVEARALEFISKNLLNFKIEIVPPGETFPITPGMICLIQPYTTTSQSYTVAFYTELGNAIVEKAGASLVWASDPVHSDNTMNDAGNYYWVAIPYTYLGTVKFNHNRYYVSQPIYFKNNYSVSGTETGYAYVYYLSRD